MANHRGVLFGGMLMEWMDEVAGIAAKRFTGTDVTTVAVEKMTFLKPIPIGAFIDVTGCVSGVGNTSVSISIKVIMDNASEEGLGDGTLVAEATFIYVALDHEGKPRKVEQTL